MFSNFKKNRAVYEIMWRNIVELGRPQMTIQSMRIACWITGCTHTHTHTHTHKHTLEYIIFTAFPLLNWLHDRATMLRYTYTVGHFNQFKGRLLDFYTQFHCFLFLFTLCFPFIFYFIICSRTRLIETAYLFAVLFSKYSYF